MWKQKRTGKAINGKNVTSKRMKRVYECLEIYDDLIYQFGNLDYDISSELHIIDKQGSLYRMSI